MEGGRVRMRWVRGGGWESEDEVGEGECECI